MLHENYLAGSIYHMTHFDNLPSIFMQGALLSKEILTRRNLYEHSIAYDSVQDLRDRISIWDSFEQHYRKLHSYVPFYFAKYPPMSYVQRTRGILDDIVFLVVGRSILNDRGVLFTDGNASMQQLSRTSGEKVGIMPATKDKLCSRRYIPGGPYGTNQNFSNFYSDVMFLETFDWEVINCVRRMEPFEEDKRMRSAEVLVPDRLSLSNIDHITVRTEKMARTVNTIAQEYGLAGFASFVTVDPSLFILP
ncbi:MAG: DUF4433 domain-containing protein [Ktedonobacteraceae bacterium]|nr:DUF4433 domain-containing protein [Ktedonobacteraceae bacterium]